MISHVLLSLMLASPPPVEVKAEVVPTYDLEQMTFKEAQKLEGKTVRVSLVIRSLMPVPVLLSPDLGIKGGHRDIELARVGGVELWRCVYFPQGVEIGSIKRGKRLTVDGRMRTRSNPATYIRRGGPEWTPAEEIIEVLEACPVRP